MENINAAAIIPETPWLTVNQVMGYEGISRVEVYRRMAAQDADFLVWREVDSKREIDPLSMTFGGQQRWRRDMLENSMKRDPDSEQLRLLPQTPRDREIALLFASLAKPQAAACVQRFKFIEPLENHDFRALGYKTKGEFIRQRSNEAGVSQRTLLRWIEKYEQGKQIAALANERPGPEIGTGNVLDDSMRAHIQGCWEIKKLTRAQTYRSLIGYLTGKQHGCGASYIYEFPHRVTVGRFINTVLQGDKNPVRGGPDLLHAYAGYMDRKYTDLTSLERVETDECKLNLFGFNPDHPVDKDGKAITPRYWLLTFYDCRSICPLVWALVKGSESDLRHGIAEEDEINLLVRLVREYGVPAAIHSDRGRFRTKTFGGKPLGEDIDKKFARSNGILDQLDIRHNMPRVHNPRGTRLERYHGFVADWFRGKPGWVGRNPQERKMARGDEDQARHILWLNGKLAPGERSPLLSHSEIFADVNKMMEAWRDHGSEGTDMRGLSPRAVFVQNTPAGGFKRITEEHLVLATAQHFENETIESGGIITLRDGARYSHPLLTLIQGEQREAVRPRHDHSFIWVRPAQKGEEVILAPRRVRVGTKDQAELAHQSEMHARLKKLVAQFGQQRSSSEFRPVPITEERVSPLVASPEPELAAEIVEPREERPAPSLYDLREITAEEF